MCVFFKLFDHIADCLVEFVNDFQIGNEKLPLGFTFSFPCRQEGLAKGTLTNWTKGFKSSGVEGKDVVELMKNAINRHPSKVQIDVCALLNDTTGYVSWFNLRKFFHLFSNLKKGKC